MQTDFPPPSSLPPPTLRLTVPAPGAPPREAIAAVIAALAALLLLAASATLGLGDEVPERRRYADVALALASHRGMLVTSGVAALSALVLGITGWRRGRALAACALAGFAAWSVAIAWAIAVSR